MSFQNNWLSVGSKEVFYDLQVPAINGQKTGIIPIFISGSMQISKNKILDFSLLPSHVKNEVVIPRYDTTHFSC